MKTFKPGNIRIDDFNIDPRLLTIHWYTSDMNLNKSMELCRSCIENWLATTGRLCWCMDTAAAGTHLQETGTLATDDYWQYVDYETKTKDLEAFLKHYLADEEKHGVQDQQQ